MSKPPAPLPNDQPSTLKINISQFIQERKFEEESPYNVFLDGQKTLIIIAHSTPESATGIQLLILGLSSLIEHYFRSVISKAVFLCRESMDCALRNAQVSLAAANYYKGENLGRAIFDNVNFSDKKIIIDQALDYLKINLQKGAPDGIKTALNDLQMIFILRHAVVHSNGFLSPKNLMELKSNYQLTSAVSTTYASFENMVEVALNSIQSYNSFIFMCLLKRAYLNENIKFDGTLIDINIFTLYWNTFAGVDCPEIESSLSAHYAKAKNHFEFIN